MDYGRAAEFCFAGAVILPGFLAYAGSPGAAVLGFVGLVGAGAVCAIGDPQAPWRRPPPGGEGGAPR